MQRRFVSLFHLEEFRRAKCSMRKYGVVVYARNRRKLTQIDAQTELNSKSQPGKLPRMSPESTTEFLTRIAIEVYSAQYKTARTAFKGYPNHNCGARKPQKAESKEEMHSRKQKRRQKRRPFKHALVRQHGSLSTSAAAPCTHTRSSGEGKTLCRISA